MLIYGQDAQVMHWACREMKLKPYPDGLYRAIGIVHNGKNIGACIWHNYHEDNFGKPLLIEVTLVTIDKRWATRQNIRELFQYPFQQLRVKRVQATTSRKAKRVRSTLSRLGFKFEGIVRDAHPMGGDAAHYSILRNECFWLKENPHRKIDALCSSSTRSDNDSPGTDRQQPGNGII